MGLSLTATRPRTGQRAATVTPSDRFTPDLVAPAQGLAYLDRQSISLSHPVTPLQAWQKIMASPLPGLRSAFAVRDAICRLFGVQRIGGFSGRPVGSPKVGDHLDFFLIEGLTPDRLTLTARDRHLDVMVCVACLGAELSITASVVTHNLFGRLYMIPVAPAHRWITRAMLRRLERT